MIIRRDPIPDGPDRFFGPPGEFRHPAARESRDRAGWARNRSLPPEHPLFIRHPKPRPVEFFKAFEKNRIPKACEGF